MSYVKTQWVNNTTPIDENNLNKIEQGIYDNSLVVDAVTNTLNPTDTETYKTAELTEGQITDVIGVNDIVIKGDTEQDGTPTPSAPVDVNVVSGSNVVNTSNKNLFIPTLKVDGTSIFVNNATVSLIKDEYTFIASNTDMYFGQVANTGATYSKINGIKIYKNGNTKLSFLVTNTTFNRAHITAYNSQGVSLGYTAFNGISGTYTFPENCEFVTIRIGKNTGIVSGTTYKTKVMVVYGDTIPTTYEPHQGKELPLDLPVENLLDNIFNQGGVDFGGTGQSTGASNRINTNLISVKPNTTYTVSNFNSNIYQFGVGLYKSDETYDSNHKINNGSWNNFPYTFTTQSDTYYIRMAFKNSNDTTLSPTGDYKIMLEQGSKANAYTPYGTDPIELCKIGDYQDYFYKSGSKWYLHKEIGSFILNGNVSFQKHSSSSSYFTAISRFTNNVPVYPETNNIVAPIICTHFDATYINDIAFNSVQKIGFSFINSKEVWFGLPTSIATNVSEVQNWLNNQINNGNPIVVHHALATSTDTEITDTTLISQLEAIYNAPLYEQTNITQTNNDLPMVLDITACKDNINGIKAFIRK